MLRIQRQTPPPNTWFFVSCKSSNIQTHFPDPHMFFSLVHKQNHSSLLMKWDRGMTFRLDLIKDCWSRFDSVSLKERSSLAILVWDQDNLHLIWLSELRGFDSLEAIVWELNPYGTKNPWDLQSLLLHNMKLDYVTTVLPKPKSRKFVIVSCRTPWTLIPVARTTPRAQWPAGNQLKPKPYWTAHPPVSLLSPLV